VLAALLFPATATAPTGVRVEFWQAKRIVRANAALQRRPGFRVERVRRIDRTTVRVCWSEPGYLLPMDGRDVGCDVVRLRGREFWVFDDSTGGGWLRWL
jgi:hypothetical protein